jgi:ABC-type ATPase with predicted acetyltransferase domain
VSKPTGSGPRTVRVSAAIRRPVPRRAAARRLAEMFGLGGGLWERLYQDFELTIEPGRIVAILGPSGSGKSVLLRQLRRRLPGAVVLRTDDLAREDRAPIDMVDPPLQAAWLDALSRCGLAEAAVLVTPARRLSAGQVYRLALARAFWHGRGRGRRGRAGVIVADEFASILDDETAAALCVRLRRWVSSQPVALVVATARASVLGPLQPDRLIVKPLGLPARSVRAPRPRRRTGVGLGRWPVRLGSIHDYHALEGFHYLTGPPAAHKRVYVIRPPRSHRSNSAAAPRVAAVLVISPPLIGVRGRDVATAGRYATGDAHAAVARLNAEVECISRVVVEPTYRSLGLAVRLVRHALRTSPAAMVESLAVMGRVHPFFELAGMTGWYVGGWGRPVYYNHLDATRPVRNAPRAAAGSARRLSRRRRRRPRRRIPGDSRR